MNYIIKNIKKTKNDYVITLNDNNKLKMDEDIFTDYYFYVGKEITEDELNNIKSNIDISKSYQYALKLCLAKPYSTYNIFMKLINNKKLNKKTANKIIDKLKANKYLDDRRYSDELIYELNQKGYGYLRIIEELKKDGISNDDIHFDYDEELEYDKAKNNIDVLLNKFKSQSIKKQKESIYNALLRLGFKNDVINLVLLSINDYDLIGEDENLKKEFIKITYKMDENTILDSKQKIIDKLLRKGYKYQSIIKVLEDV